MKRITTFLFSLFLGMQMQAQSVVDIIVNSPNHNTLEAAVIAADLAGTLSTDGPFTVFAPTDAAFAALPAGTLDALLADPSGQLTDILLYHVVGAVAFSGDLVDGAEIATLLGSTVVVSLDGGVFINGAQVTVADIPAENGVVHVIDAVLLPPPAINSVVDVIVNSPDHTILETAVIEAGLVGALSGAGPFTVFAPTDAAFALLPAGTIEALLADPTGLLTDILLYHVVQAYALSSGLSDGMMLTTMLGQDVTVEINGGVFINGAQVIVADIETPNGVVHVIDAVLLPEFETNTVVDVIINSDDHTILEEAVIAAGLVETLQGPGPFTVFAPTDAAFANLPPAVLEAALNDPQGLLTEILFYHVVNDIALSGDLFDGQEIVTLNGLSITVAIIDGDVYINDALVTVADIITDNGVVHVIDAVLVPTEEETTTVWDIITNSDIHTTLEAAVLAAGLDEDLSAPGALTVFAPTDEAFSLLPAGTIAALLADPNGLLTEILLYHVVGGVALSGDLSNGQEIVTLNGQSVLVTINQDGVFINDAQVIIADLTADNGVVHVIDAVLNPQETPATVVDIIVNSPVHTILEAAVIEAELVGTLSGPGPWTVFAPTDAAFEALPAGVLNDLLADPTGALAEVLTYHVVNAFALSTDLSDGQIITTVNGQTVEVTIDINGNVFINDAQVIIADIIADNGVVHVIDAVLVPTAEETTVWDIISNSPDHTILETAILQAQLDGVLDEPGTYTVFAPTDDAFLALPAGTLDAVLADNDLLTAILLYHVVGSVALSTDLSNGQTIATLQGQDVTITINNGVFVNGEQVVAADLLASNGVVHVIDGVLLPIIAVNEVMNNVSVALYPNPAENFLNVNISGSNDVVQFEIVDMTGKRVEEGALMNNNNIIDIQNLTSGFYTIRILNNNVFTTQSFVKK